MGCLRKGKFNIKWYFSFVKKLQHSIHQQTYQIALEVGKIFRKAAFTTNDLNFEPKHSSQLDFNDVRMQYFTKSRSIVVEYHWKNYQWIDITILNLKPIIVALLYFT